VFRARDRFLIFSTRTRVLTLRVVDERRWALRPAQRERGDPPGWFMPSSTTPARWCVVSSCRSRSKVSGTPMWLFRLPAVGFVAEPGAQGGRDHLRVNGSSWQAATAINGR
jgi:hypothetical protein